MKVEVLHNQSLLDILLQHTGSLAGIFDAAMANGKSITGDLIPGQTLNVPAGIEKDNDILGYYSAKGVKPATAIQSGAVASDGGISIWAVNNDFIVQ